MNALPFENLPVSKPRTFVPAKVDWGDWAQIEPLYDKLKSRIAACKTTTELEQWLLDWGELGAALDQDRAERYIAMTCHTEDEAIEKAYLEWIQGCIFAGFQRHYQPELKFKKTSELKDFDAHAVYYSLYPEEWKKVPLLKKKRERATKIYPMVQVKATEIQMSDLLQRLKTEGIRLFYRNLTLPDVAQTGLKVVRVLSPDLSLLHGDENIPFLGGRIRDVEWRYPEFSEKDLCFPNPYPHPLA